MLWLLSSWVVKRQSSYTVRAWTTAAQSRQVSRLALAKSSSYNRYNDNDNDDSRAAAAGGLNWDDWDHGLPAHMMQGGVYDDDQDVYGGAIQYDPAMYESDEPLLPDDLLYQPPPSLDDDENSITVVRTSMVDSTKGGSSQPKPAPPSSGNSKPLVTSAKKKQTPTPAPASTMEDDFAGLQDILVPTEAPQPTAPPAQDLAGMQDILVPAEQPQPTTPPVQDFVGLQDIWVPVESETMEKSTPSPNYSASNSVKRKEKGPEYMHVADTPTDNKYWSRAASRGQATMESEIEDIRETQIPALEREIFQFNNNEPFNTNSPQQVSMVLFGVKGKSTNKLALEDMASGGNKLADLILQHRTLVAKLKKWDKRAALVEQGTRVQSVSTVARPNATETSEPSDPLLLVDASSYIFRAYYSMPPIHRSDGMPTGAVLGFCNMLNRLVLNRLMEGEQPRMILAFDAPGPSFRKSLYPAYKANRPQAPVDLIPQFDLIRHASDAYGIPIVEETTFEADDVIATLATLAHQQGLDVHILSGDKDLMQLVTGPNVVPCIHMIDPMSMARIDYDQVVEKWGVGPDQLGDVLALAGDTADNVPGVPGIGPKTASTLLEEYKDLDTLLENAENIKQKSRREKLINFADQARLSRALVALEDSIPGMAERVGELPSCRTEPLDADRILAFYDEMGFKDAKRRFLNQLQRGASRARPKSRSGRAKVEIPRPEEFADVPF